MSASLTQVGRLLTERPRRGVLELAPDDLVETAAQLLGGGYRLALVGAHDEIDTLKIVYLFVDGPPDQRVELCVRVPSEQPRVPSIAHLSFPAGRFEREMYDLYGVEPVGHPQRRPLVLHQHWPTDWHPMRKNAGPSPAMNEDARSYPFAEVEGAGVYEIPVGPVHAGVIEPGHFRFWVVGETIVRMKSRLWFTHKGVERLFEGRDLSSALTLSERISGDSAVSHSLAFCLAVEEALDIEVTSRTNELRSVLLELERLYNHVADVGALCNDVGFGLANARALTLREHLLRLNETVSGHRLLRGGVRVGGASLRALPQLVDLHEIGARFHEIVDLAHSQTIVMDRFTGTGVLTKSHAREIGVLGVVARASGSAQDARSMHPFVDASDAFRVVHYDAGDVLARFQVRCDEVDVSLGVLADYVSRRGSLFEHTDERASERASYGSGIVEGWRGAVVHRVEFDDDGDLARVKIVDPSFFAWPALSVALTDTIVPDFPLVNKSFNLSYAGNDL